MRVKSIKAQTLVWVIPGQDIANYASRDHFKLHSVGVPRELIDRQNIRAKDES